MKANYASWHIDPTEFPRSGSNLEKLVYFARYAVLAPSIHNTQPWRFESEGQSLLLLHDPTRHLTHSGDLVNEPYLSLGACLETLQLAAQGFGYKIKIDDGIHGDTVARISIADSTVANPELLTAITGRTSNRNPYDRAPLPAGQLGKLAATGLNGVTATFLTKEQDISYIAGETSDATLAIVSDSRFRHELSQWVRPNMTRRHDGMPGFVQGIPTPVSLIAKTVIRNVDVSKDQARKDSQRILHSAALALISVDSAADKSQLLRSGMAYARMCVVARSLGLDTSAIIAATAHKPTNQAIAKKLDIKGTPVAIIRLGRASRPARHSPRLPLTMVYNG